MTNPFDIQGEQQRERDERHQSAVKAKARRERWAKLMSVPNGRGVVMDILEWTGVFMPSFSTNGSVMSFNEGRRDIGLAVLAQVQEAAPAEFATLMEEYNGRDE